MSKLGIKAGFEVCAIGASADYAKLVGVLPDGVVSAKRLSKNADLVHHFATSRTELAKALNAYRAKLKPTAVVWVSWPKKSAKVPTDITEDVVRELALPLGFVDVKVCAVTDIWSGLKLVVRKELR